MGQTKRKRQPKKPTSVQRAKTPSSPSKPRKRVSRSPRSQKHGQDTPALLARSPEEEFRVRQELLQSITTNLPCVVYRFYGRPNGEMGLYYVSDRITEIFGLPPDLQTALPLLMAGLHPDDRESFFNSIRNAILHQCPWDYEGRYIRPDGKTIWFKGASSPLSRGDEVIFDGFLLDITEHKAAENELLQSKAFLEALMSALPVPVYHKDIQGRYTGTNKAFEAFFGSAEGELIGKTVYDIAPKELADAYHASDTHLFAHSGQHVFESRLVDANQTVHDVIFHKSTLTDMDGNVVGLVGAIDDITERKHAEDALRASEANLRYRLELEEAIAEISTVMLKPGWEEFDTRVNWALERIGTQADVDRSYLFLFSENGQTWSNTHEWCAPGVVPQKDDLQNIPTSTYPEFIDPLERGDPFIVSGTDDFPAGTEAFRAILEAGGIQSLIAVPIAWDGRLRGFFGFDSVREKRIWPEADLRVARILAEILARALQHIEAERALRENAWFLENLDRISSILMQRENDPRLLENLISTIREIFAADRAFLLYPCNPNASSFRVPVESVAPGYPGAFAANEDVLIDAAASKVLQTVVASNQPIVYHFATEPEPPEIAVRYGIQSEITVALRPQHDQPWMLGLHQCSHDREWTASEERLFKIAAERISDALSGYLLLQRLQESQANLQTLFNTVGDFLFILDMEGCILFHNPVVPARLNYTEDELRGKSVLELHPPQHRTAAAEIVAAVLAGTADHCDVPLMTRDGTLIPVDTRVAHGTWSGQPALFGISRDITELKRVEETLRNREQLLRKQSDILLSLMQGGSVLRGDLKRGIAEITEACSDIVGTERVSVWLYSEDYSVLRCVDLYERSRHSHASGEELPSSEFPAYREAHQSGKVIAATDVFTHPHTRELPVSYYHRHGIRSLLDVPLWLHNRMGGTLSFEHTREQRVWTLEEERLAVTMATLISLCFETSERRQTEEALRASEVKYRRLHESMMDGFAATDLDGHFQEFNRTYIEMLGYPEEQLRAMTYKDLTPERWHDAETRILREQVLANGYSDVYEKEYRRADGTVFPVELRTYLMRNDAGQPTGYWAVVRDITERKKTEEMLWRMQFTVENAPDGVQWVNANGDIVFANDTSCRVLGYTREELLSMTIFDIDPTFPREEWTHHWSKTSVPGTYRLSTQHRTKDGRVYPVEVAINSVQFGNENYHVDFYRDITDRRQAEEQRIELERRLLHAQKLESLGVLAGGIAHDFNNLLMAVLGNLDMALLDLSEASPIRDNIEQAIQATRRATHLTRQMLAYSGRGRFVVTHTNLNELVQENADIFRTAIARTIEMDVRLAPEPCIIEADPGQIQQVVMNLITNASEAIGEKTGTIVLSTGSRVLDEGFLGKSLLEEKPDPGRFGCIEVSDTGCGMDEETIRRIFEPFFTTKFTGRGLGMSAVLGIVRGHRGAIFVDSAKDKGTTITVAFPLLESAIASVAKKPLSPLRTTGVSTASGTILVVDDEETVRTVCAALVARLGFKTVTAANGEEGLKAFAERAPELVCVLLDLTMPGMDGVEAFHEMKKIRPDVPVILCSGYNQQDATRRFTGEGLAGFIQKPYRIDSLREMVKEVLRERERDANG